MTMTKNKIQNHQSFSTIFSNHILPDQLKLHNYFVIHLKRGRTLKFQLQRIHKPFGSFLPYQDEYH